MRNLYSSVSAVVSSRNRFEQVKRLIESLKTSYPDIEIIVVDDASDVPYFLVDIKLIRNEKRIGAPASRNRGIEAAAGRYVLMLDDDIEIGSDFIEKGFAVFDEFPDVKMVVPEKIDIIDGKESKVSCFVPRLPDGFLRVASVKRGRILFGAMVFLAEKQALIDAGGYDSTFGLESGHSYREESDLQLRLRKRGHNIFFEPEMVIYHHIIAEGGQDQEGGRKAYWRARNHIIFLKKHFVLWQLRALFFVLHVLLQGHIRDGISGWADGVRWVI